VHTTLFSQQVSSAWTNVMVLFQLLHRICAAFWNSTTTVVKALGTTWDRGVLHICR
jgi:hypothetical protein